MKRKWLLMLAVIVLFAGAALAEALVGDASVSGPMPLPTATPAPRLPLLVNNDNPLPDGYQPQELVKLYDHKRSFKLSDSNIYMEAHVFKAMNEMFLAARKDGIKGFIVTSGYRTLKEQTKLFKNDKKGVAAKPGHSEHETGLAFDVTAFGNENFAKTAHFKWLRKNCWDYGFIIRYPKGKEDITGIVYEPWHYRYVGMECAQAIGALGGYVTLEEYCAVGGDVSQLQGPLIPGVE